ncbi:MAG: helix-turn-helix domain-containing protein, partial [Planctomycetales bacterium]|nr:helix-turn-helix domain-containing protein [Planctomycetales bacterium]
ACTLVGCPFYVRLQLEKVSAVKNVTSTGTYLTPPQVSRLLGIAKERIHEFIRNGELRAVNVARNLNGQRPRWRISPQALADFESNRSNSKPKPPAAPRGRRRAAKPVRDYLSEE